MGGLQRPQPRQLRQHPRGKENPKSTPLTRSILNVTSMPKNWLRWKNSENANLRNSVRGVAEIRFEETYQPLRPERALSPEPRDHLKVQTRNRKTVL